MTVADEGSDGLREQLRLPRNMRLRLTGNGLTLVPVTGAHRTARRRIENQIEERLPGWEPVGGFAVTPPREGHSPEPDASAVPSERFKPGDSKIMEDQLPFVVEVVSPESEGRDYSTKADHYAMRGIPAYLVVNVLTARWTLLTLPENDDYQHSESGKFGEEIRIPVGDQTLVLDSSTFMRV
ncbi:Uma2 family endonuclease [Streptomyces sp. LX-29]|uniref:Uma2 family endonuclease n=1 Tax=Streptomyces sp. LX-29 TaxID=2900152 RepID=UPI00240E4800|nr:Uma2 family endonuclease [Streptomyces sp. LX-29]WFB09867.1 Uma2 family endonuclease [Streptomyces sp. LX-29]